MIINNDVLAVLSQSIISDNAVALTGQLDRKLYLKTNEVLEAAGGKWNRKSRTHLFSSDPTDIIEQVILTGEILKPQDFGYFPSYTLGNIYSAQIYNTARKEIKGFDALVENGELIKIKEWLSEKIHKHGKLLEPAEILMQVTGEEINPKYLIDYLENKYKEIYNL
jgi:carboxypeptidase Taq